MSVSPSVKHPGYHITLSDGTATIGLKLCNGRGQEGIEGIRQSSTPRTSMRISQGNTGYSDFEPPYTPIAQTAWDGGRGADEYETDTSRFYDQYCTDTIRGDVLLGPKANETSGYYSYIETAISSTETRTTYRITGDYYIASPITTSGAISIRRVKFKGNNSATELVINSNYDRVYQALICADNSGVPGTVVAASGYYKLGQFENASGLRKGWFDIPFSQAVSLSGSTTYWIVLHQVTGNGAFKSTPTPYQSGWSYLSNRTGKELKLSSDGTTWTSYAIHNIVLDMKIETVASGEAKFFQYKRQLYCVTKSDDNAAPALFMNGYRGIAQSNSSNKAQLKTGLTLTANELTGKIALISSGPGSYEEIPWRVIMSNTTGGICECNPPWNTAHTTATEYVILGCDTWQQVTGLTALKYPVTDVCVLDDRVYFAQGLDQSDGYIVRWRHYNSSGTWTSQHAADGTAKARFLKMVIGADGVRKIWRNGSGNNDVSSASVPAWGTGLTFGNNINCGSENEVITGLETYGTPTSLYVFKEGSYGCVANGVYAEVPNGEMASVASFNNGRASLRHDLYLYFSLLDGLDRYFNQRLDDIGPNRDEGFPLERKGVVRKIIGYPGRMYVAYDAGEGGYSCVLCWNQTGWHEIYRSPIGAKIRNIHVQVLHGMISRLWVSQDEDLVWLPITLSPRHDERYTYASEGTITSAWMYGGGLKEVTKFFKSAAVFAENLAAGHCEVDLEYQTDDEGNYDDWHMAGTFTESPVEEIDLSDTMDVTGKRFRYRLTLRTDDSAVTPRIKAVVIYGVTRTPPKQTWNITFLAEDSQKDFNGITNGMTAKELFDQLLGWADSRTLARPLLMRSSHVEFDNKWVFIDPASVQPMTQSTTPNRHLMSLGSIAVYEA